MLAQKFTTLAVVPEGSNPDLGTFMLEVVGTDKHLMFDVQNEEVIGFRGRPLRIRKQHPYNYRTAHTGYMLETGKVRHITVAVDGWLKRLAANPLADIPKEDQCDLATIGFPGYVICKNGDLWSKYHWDWLQPILSLGKKDTSVGGWIYQLSKRNSQGRCVTVRVSIATLLAKAFIPNPLKHSYVKHKDGDCWNLDVENLEWVACHPCMATRWNRLRSAMLSLVKA